MQPESLSTSGFAAPVIPPSQQAMAAGAPASQPYAVISSSGPMPPATGATPMTWAGTGVTPTGIEPRKKSNAALIAIPIVLLVLIAGGVGAYFVISGMKGSAGDGGKDVKTAKTTPGDEGDRGVGEKKTAGDEGDSKAVKEDEAKAADEDKMAIIKFRTDPEGATVLQKTGVVERELCKTECEYEFEKSKKDMKIVFIKSGYHDEELDLAADVPYKEVMFKLTEKSKKKKSGPSKVSVVSKDEKPSGAALPVSGKDGKDKKAPVIRLIDSDKDSGKSGGKKKPVIRLIPNQ
jgi:hypothetical protein